MSTPFTYALPPSCYAPVRIRWDEKKRQWVLKRRQIDFAVLDDLFCLPYLEDQRSDDPEQCFPQ